ncbi:MAG: amino acid adenylation domain-containing protein [Kastovskya adunca ATA6-11-RM4]|jgi:amino acid adenylation domain-containing protein|nr:amino acid adenylation domain-containing protein [Kastovskya adunca ATA6-11-RM4]
MPQSFNAFPESLLYSTWVDLLRQRTLQQPEQLAFTFLPDGEIEGEQLTYRELDRRSRAIASQLQALGLSGERALLLYPPGLDYLAAFFGCLYAGVVAVPAYPPRNQRNTPRIQAIAKDAQAAIALTTTAVHSKVQSLLTEKADLGNLQWLTTDNLASGIEENWQQPFIKKDTLAFLQYTSGSTGTPKGVMLSHGNLLHNAAMTYCIMEHSPSSKFISWLPAYHDMGLIGGILQPLYGGFPCIFMPPAAFLQRPYRWLQAISQYKGTTSGAPNFAYELCIHKITPEQLQTLDLSSWDVAFNGAEPIRQDTLERFWAKFADCGFRPSAFYPCYGMAEATLMVSGSLKSAPPTIKTVRVDALERHQIIAADADNEDVCTFVSCGKSIPEQQIVIADPETLTRCQPDEVGEIWVSGSSVGQGYWHRPEETEQTFQAYPLDTDTTAEKKPFLRTGDLGFLQDGELFVTGRVKDLIIIRGRNLYPQDIELTSERSHSALRLGSSAAFSVEVEGEERLVVVQELEFRAKPDVEEVIAAIRQTVSEEHEVQVYGVVLIKPGSIPKTSSGKIQRRACRAKFLAGELDVIGSSILDTSIVVNNERNLTRETLLVVEPEERQQLLESYLQEQVAQVLRATPSAIDGKSPLSRFGLDSLMVFELKNRIEADFGVEVAIADFFEGISIAQLTTQVLNQVTSADWKPVSVSIDRVQNTSDVHPLSFAQQRLWFIDQLEKGNPAYNISVGIHLKGSLDVTVLERSLNEIVRRHEALRTSFSIAEGQPVQAIAPCVTLALQVVDCQQLLELERESRYCGEHFSPLLAGEGLGERLSEQYWHKSEVQRLATEEAQQPFDLTREPLWRVKLLRLGEQEHVLLLTLHHIIGDEWSVEVFIREMAILYKAFLASSPLPLPDLPVQYTDFAYWQRQWLQGELLETQLSYWKQQLNGVPSLQLPTDRPRPAVQTYRGARQSLELPKSLTDAIATLSRQEGVTPFMVLLAAFQTFLYRYTGQDDIPVGSPIANRNRSELNSLIGFFVNTLVLRTDLGDNPSFRELLSRVRQVALGAYTHQDLPFDQLVEALRPVRDASYTPLFQVSFALRKSPQLEEIPGLALSLVNVETLTAQFDLSLFVDITEQGLIASFEYNTDLFEAATIARMLGHFQNLLLGIVSNPNQRLSDLPLLTASERHQLLVAWNDTEAEYPADLCIHQLFEAQVERTPDAIALVFENQQLTYRELNNRANQLAHYLKQLGVKPDVLVGLCLERSLEMVVGILGILKAGGAYVPLDPAYPKDRLAFMLSDRQVPVLLTQKRLLETLPEHAAKVVCLDTDWESIRVHSDSSNSPPQPPLARGEYEEKRFSLGDRGEYEEGESQEGVESQNPSSLAYVIYTSGSTGQPKGVLVSHANVVRLFAATQPWYHFNEQDVWTLFHSYAFDFSVWEIWGALLYGGRLVVVPYWISRSPESFYELLCKEQVTVLNQTPSAFRQLIRAEEIGVNSDLSLRLVIFGGEALEVQSLKPWFERHGDQVPQLVNMYGITETTVHVTYRPLTMSDLSGMSSVIGRPIPDLQVYVLDRHHQPVPIGVPGELYIGGAGLACGYLNRPELTTERFIRNPFDDKVDARLYKSGDLVRYLPNGDLEYLGRIDQQVKIRGFRIELGEIEAVLGQHPAVQDVVVMAREDIPGVLHLVAYVVPNPKQMPNISELRQFLQARLPDYMIPASFVLLEALPLTSNGKVDRRGLPAPESHRPDLQEVYQAPRSEVERAIATVWQSVLHLEKVGIHDNFFDLGGHSLLMIQVNNKLQDVFNRDLSIVELFQNPTISSLAQSLSKKSEESSAFDPVQDRVQKQLEAINKRKKLLTKQKNTH